MKKNKGTTFGEMMIVFLIIATALIIFLRITSDYIRTLVFAKEMFIMESLLQEKYQMLIAYRNKLLEQGYQQGGGLLQTNFSFNSGNFCIDFNTSTKKIDLKSCSGEEAKFINGKIVPIKYWIFISATNDYVSSTIYASNPKILISIIPKKTLELTLWGFITPWHPSFQ